MVMTVDSAIDLFLQDVGTRCVPSTREHYKKRLQSFKTAFAGVPVDQLTPDSIKLHLACVGKWPDGTPKAPDTIRTNVVSWEQLQKFLVECGQFEKRLMDPIKKPGGRKRETLPSNDEIRKILEKVGDDFRLIYRALRLTGARPGELCGAKISDIDSVAGEIVLKYHKTVGKTGKPRRIAIGHPSLVEIIATAIGGRTEGNIFLRRNGKPWDTPTISTAFRKARDAAGLRRDIVLYLTRHEHATTLYKLTGDLKTVADALGHAQLSTTMRYTRVDGELLKKNQCLFVENLD